MRDKDDDDLKPPPLPGAPPPVDPPARRHRGRKWALAAAGSLVLLVALLGGMLWWGGTQERGTAWVLERLPGVEVIRPHGSFLGDFGADQLLVRYGDGGELRLVNVAWSGLRLQRGAPGPAWARVQFQRLSAEQAFLVLPPPKETTRTPPPEQLQLPVELLVEALQIGELHLAALGDQPLRDLQARVHLGAEAGRLHRIDGLRVARGPLQAEGHARVGAEAPMNADVLLRLQQPSVAQWPAWNATLQLQGALARAQLRGDLQAHTQPAQTLRLNAVVQPFAEWPLAQLNAHAQALDLSALLAGGPQTALDGSVTLAEANAEQPLQAEVALHNRAAGAWNTGRLPVRELQLRLQADPRDRSQLLLPLLQAELGGTEAAGRLSGEGKWTVNGWTVQTQLANLRPDRLDARAPALAVQGQLTLQGQGFGGGGVGPPPTRRTVDVQAALNARRLERGRAGQPVALQMQAAYAIDQAGPQQLTLRQLQAESGPSKLRLQAQAQRDAATAPWRGEGELALAQFDLQDWWPSLASSRLNAQGRFRLSAPADTTQDPLRQLARIDGGAELELQPSQWAGVPLRGQLRANGSGRAEGLQVALDLHAADNQMQLNGRLAPQPADDRWQLQLNAPALQRLAPLVQTLHGQRTQVGGRLQAKLALQGRWPQLRTEGQATAQQLAWPGLQLREGQASWTLGTGRGAPMVLDLRLAGLAQAGAPQAQRVPRLNLKVDGTADSHRLALQAEVAAAPPSWADGAQAAAGGPRSFAVLRAQGGWLQGREGLQGWQGRVDELDIRRAEAREPLLRAGAVALVWRSAQAAQPARIEVQPGRADVLGGALRWARLQWQGASGNRPALLDADATLEPMAVAPLLARLQPQAGWTGDLRVSGRILVRTAPVLRADVTLQRESGDLRLNTAERSLALGLQRLRLAVQAQGTQWQASADVAGQSVGSLALQGRARTTPSQPWPGTATPVQGTLQLRVADLGVYDPWLPVGWRLDGQLLADARINGRLGAPEFAGQLQGTQLAVTNFLEGVRVRDGELRVSLQGERARIERLVARAGDGVLRVEGGAQLGAQPSAQLTLVAERFRALGRVDRRLDLSGRAQLQLDAQRVALNGRLQVDDGLIDLGRREAPELSKDVVIVDDPQAQRQASAFGGGSSASGTRATTAPKRQVAMDLRLDLGRQLRVRGRGIDTLLAGDLRVTAPAGQLALDGTVRTVGGRYEAYGEKLVIDRGVISFVGPVANPRLDIEAVRTDLEDVRVGVAITGSAQNPRVRLFSTPEMSELDKLSWLTLGRPSTELASNQTALLQRAALALWAGERGGGGEGIAKRLGLDTLSVRRGDSGGLSDAVITLGKQVSERVYVGYQQSLDATGGSLELIYKIAKRFQLRLQTGDSTAIDLVWSWLRD